MRLSEEGIYQSPVVKEGDETMDDSEFADFGPSTIRKEPNGTPSKFSCA